MENEGIEKQWEFLVQIKSLLKEPKWIWKGFNNESISSSYFKQLNDPFEFKIRDFGWVNLLIKS